MRSRSTRHRAVPETLRCPAHPRMAAWVSGGGETTCIRRRLRHAGLTVPGRRTWQRRKGAGPGLDATATGAVVHTVVHSVLSHLRDGQRRAGAARSDDDRALLQTGGPAAAASSGRHRTTVHHVALLALVGAYGGDTYRLLTALADLLGASVAYVDRPTVEAHLERGLSGREWAAVAGQLLPMAFDDHVGEAGSFPTDGIDDVLTRAGVPGRGRTLQIRPATVSPRRRP